MVVHNFNPSIYEPETDSFSYIVNLRLCYMRHCLNKTEQRGAHKDGQEAL